MDKDITTRREDTIDKNGITSTLITDVREIIKRGLQKAYQDANATTVFTYWQVGRRIVEEEQHGSRRAEYGSKLITTLAEVLSSEYA